jgi:hypothetical protein
VVAVAVVSADHQHGLDDELDVSRQPSIGRQVCGRHAGDVYVVLAPHGGQVKGEAPELVAADGGEAERPAPAATYPVDVSLEVQGHGKEVLDVALKVIASIGPVEVQLAL